MAAPLISRTALDEFRARKDSPLIQFLTWYILLVREWKFEDITEISLKLEWEKYDFCAGIREKMPICFTLSSGLRESWEVIKVGDDRFYVASSWGMIEG